MSETLTGKLLVASPMLEDPNFLRSVVLVCAHDESGAFGVVLNRPLIAPVLDHVPLWTPLVCAPPVVFAGGPVETSSVLALGRSSRGESDAWSPVAMDTGLVDLRLDPEEVRDEVEGVRLFSGYAGWGGGQLEAEITGEAWYVVEPEAEDAFTPEPDRLWRQVLRRQPSQLQMLAFYPTDPRLN